MYLLGLGIILLLMKWQEIGPVAMQFLALASASSAIAGAAAVTAARAAKVNRTRFIVISPSWVVALQWFNAILGLPVDLREL